MKVNQPLTEEDYIHANKEHERVAKNQITMCKDLARKLKEGVALTSLESSFAAAMLEASAMYLIKTERPKGAGKPTKLPDEARLMFALDTVVYGKSANGSIERIAEKFDVSDTAVKKKLGKAGSGPERELAKQETEKVISWVAESKT